MLSKNVYITDPLNYCDTVSLCQRGREEMTARSLQGASMMKITIIFIVEVIINFSD